MKIILGKNLDGTTYRGIETGHAHAGRAYTGPLSFVRMLETRLGLPCSDSTPVLRTVAFEEMLAGINSPDYFFHDSFEADSMGVAAFLLSLRDELYMSAPSSFQLSALLSGPQRLQVFAKMDNLDNTLPFGLPDRLRSAISELKETPVSLPLKEICLTENKEYWEPLWQELFGILAERNVVITPFKFEKSIPSAVDLKNVQLHLSNPDADPKEALSDGSLLGIEAVNRFEAADITTMMIKHLVKAGDQIAIVSEQESASLAASMARADMPLVSYSVDSYGLDALYVIPLCLQLSWQPVSSSHMQQYLNLKVSPLPGALRSNLLSITHSMGATGGNEWDAIIEDYVKTHKKEKKNLDACIETWLNPGILKTSEPMDSSYITALCEKYSAWATRYAGADEHVARALRNGAKFAEALIRICSIKKGAGWKQTELNRCISMLIESFQQRGKSRQKLGAPLLVQSPSAILAPVDTLIWWDAGLKSLGNLQRSFWTKSENTWLESQNISIPDSSIKLKYQSESWKQMASMANKKVVFVYSRDHGQADTPDEIHPFWHELTAAFDPNSRSRLIIKPDALEGVEPQIKTLFSGLKGNKPALIKPAFKSSWKISKKLSLLRDKESPSSLETMTACPLAYVMRYIAGIESGQKVGLPSGPLLYGTIAHEVIGRFLASCKKWPDQEKAAFELNGLYDSFIKSEAALLSQPGMEDNQSMLRRAVIQAGSLLVGIMKNGHYEFIDAEELLESKETFGPFSGRCDLKFKKKEKNGPCAIIDMKWSGYTYRKALLQDGNAFQLASYWKLQGGGNVLTGFLIINKAALLTVHPGQFPGSAGVDGPDESQTWQRLESCADKIRKKLKNGTVPVGMPEGKGDPELLHASCGFCDYSHFCRIDDFSPEPDGEVRS